MKKGFKVDRKGSGLYDIPRPANYSRPPRAISRNISKLIAPSKVAPIYLKKKEDKQGFRPYRAFGKRLLDITFVLATLPFTLPVILVCAFALWVEGGKPFYTQPRLGRGNKSFPMIKLRTMVQNADVVLEKHLAANAEMRLEWNEMQKLRHDPRVTHLGRLLRTTSLDELPQLFNILRGDMSLVGPRPMMPNQLGLYGNADDYFKLLPGITGLWQVSSRNNNRFSHRRKVDTEYNEKLSLLSDLKIIGKTFGVVLRRTGC